MAWFRIPWRPWTHEKLPQSVDEEHIRDPRPKYIQTSHEFSWAITVLNLLLTILTITVVSLPEKPQRYLGLDALVEQPCNCQTPVVDRRYKNPKLNPDIKRVSGYSPILDEVDLTPQPTVLNGLFHDNNTIYMQDPSPEVDEAWELFSKDLFLAPDSAVRDAGRSLSKSIHLPTSPEGEAGKYLATWDVFHQIHCLNWLRKAANWEYYYGNNKPGPVYSSHQKHCTHMLLQSLMCNADVDMITFDWMEKPKWEEGHEWAQNNDSLVGEVTVGDDSRKDNSPNSNSKVESDHSRQAAIPAANFHVHKMCRNFSALAEWAKKNREDDPAGMRTRLKVPDHVQLIHWDDY